MVRHAWNPTRACTSVPGTSSQAGAGFQRSSLRCPRRSAASAWSRIRQTTLRERDGKVAQIYGTIASPTHSAGWREIIWPKPGAKNPRAPAHGNKEQVRPERGHHCNETWRLQRGRPHRRAGGASRRRASQIAHITQKLPRVFETMAKRAQCAQQQMPSGLAHAEFTVEVKCLKSDLSASKQIRVAGLATPTRSVSEGMR